MRQADPEEIRGAELLEKQEIGLSYLYRTLARKFEADVSFWNDLAEAENNHAFLIRAFRELLKEGKLEHEPRVFNNDRIEKNLSVLNQSMNRIMREGVTREQALQISAEMESQMLEEDIFAEKPEDPAQLKNLLKVLREETKIHHVLFLTQINKSSGG